MYKFLRSDTNRNIISSILFFHNKFRNYSFKNPADSDYVYAESHHASVEATERAGGEGGGQGHASRNL